MGFPTAAEMFPYAYIYYSWPLQPWQAGKIVSIQQHRFHLPSKNGELMGYEAAAEPTVQGQSLEEFLGQV